MLVVTLMARGCDAVTTGVSESVTVTVKLDVPSLSVVPVIVPVAALSAKPAGKVPLDILQEYGGVPPTAARVWVYGVPTWLAPKNVVLTFSGCVMVSVRLTGAV